MNEKDKSNIYVVAHNYSNDSKDVATFYMFKVAYKATDLFTVSNYVWK